MKKLLTAASAFLLISNLYCQSLSIQMSFTPGQDCSKNFLTWTWNKTKNQDYCDTQTSASVKQSTRELKKIFTAPDNKTFIAPAPLYKLLLCSVSPTSVWQNEEFNYIVKGKKVTIIFTHRGSACKIESDENGNLLLDKSFMQTSIFAQNHSGKFTVNEMYAKDNDSTKVDLNKLDFALCEDHIKQINHFIGKLKISVKDGTIRINGTIKQEE